MMGFITSLSLTKALAEECDVCVYICNPGEDASTQMRFSFHTNVSGVTVQIAKKSDGNFDNAIKLTPECISNSEAYPFEGMKYESTYDYKTMQVCEADVSNLEPDTEYMYRIGATHFTETRYFKTAGNDGVWSFVVMADPQNYSTNGLVGGIQEDMDKAMINAQKMGLNPELVLCAGDMVNHGGILGYWDSLYKYVNIYKQMPLACCVGNHDWIDSVGGSPGDKYITAAAWNAPDNGPSDYLEDVYYFIWNNILFVIMDSESGRVAPQEEWFKEVASTLDYQYLITMYHQGQWGGRCVPNKWLNTFEEYGIDLSFAGDNHDYGRGSTKVGPERGQAAFPDHYVVCDDTRNTSNVETNMGGYLIVKVTPTCMYYYAFDQNDNIRDQAVFQAQRPLTADESFSKEAFEKSFKVECNEKDATKATISFDKNYIGHVRYISFYNEKGNLVKKLYTNSYNVFSLGLSGLKIGNEYNYKATIEYRDGTFKDVEIPFTAQVNYGKYANVELKETASNYRVTFDINGVKTSLFNTCKVYVNGEYVTEYSPSARLVSLDKELITEDVEIKLYGVVSGIEYLIGEYSSNAPQIELTVETKSLELTEGEEGLVKATATEGGVVKYASSDASVATVDATGKVKALKAGTATITVTVEGTELSETVTVKVNAKEEEVKENTVKFIADGKVVKEEKVEEGKSATAPADPTKEGYEFKGWDKDFSKVTSDLEVNAKFEKVEEPEPIDPEPVDPEPVDPTPGKKGCGAGAIQMVYSLITIFGLAVVFKRRKF